MRKKLIDVYSFLQVHVWYVWTLFLHPNHRICQTCVKYSNVIYLEEAIGWLKLCQIIPHRLIWKFAMQKDFELQRRLDILKNYFQLMMYAAMASPNCNENQVKESAKKLISTQVFNKPDINWVVASHDNHDDYDVTFTVPLPNQKAIRVSYRT